jgi:transcriptional regulator with XRE-family HTH domain
MSNIVSGRQIRAARMLAGLTQADLARAAGCHPRSVRYWENKGSNPPTNVASTLDCIEQALNRHGVIPFSTPTPGSDGLIELNPIARMLFLLSRDHGRPA